MKLRIDTPIEIDYYRHGGILPFVLRQCSRKIGAQSGRVEAEYAGLIATILERGSGSRLAKWRACNGVWPVLSPAAAPSRKPPRD